MTSKGHGRLHKAFLAKFVLAHSFINRFGYKKYKNANIENVFLRDFYALRSSVLIRALTYGQLL